MNHARQEALRHRLVRHREIPCGKLVRRICELMQGHTQHRTLRPFGVCLLFAGYDKNEGFQLFTSDPAGSCIPWNATCIGKGRQTGQWELKKFYSQEMECNEACELAIRTLMILACDTGHAKPKTADIQMVVMKESLSGGAQIDFMTEDDIDLFRGGCSARLSDGEDAELLAF
jgi:20S proteasome alpha/beta subunit